MSSKILSVEWTTASLHKAGNRPAENEDATATGQDGLRFAVCDGATEGWESGPWAVRLATAYVDSPPDPASFPAWVAGVRQGWTTPPGAVSWYAAEKQEQGSFATLIGLELRRSKSNGGWAWRAVAVGDSCLFHVRAGQIETAFPLTASAEFGNRPSLIPSSPTVRCPAPTWLAGRAAPGDLLLLATDAVAANLLALPDPAAWGSVLTAVGDSLRTGNPAALVERLQLFQARTNDDMTLTAICLPDIPELS